MMVKKFLIAIGLLMVLSYGVFASDNAAEKTVRVSGEAVVYVVPDEIVINIGITSEADDLKKAKKDNDAKVTALIELARKLQIEPKDIQTDHVNLRPVPENYSSIKTKGYSVSKNISIVLRDIAVYESFVSQAIESGVNNIYGIEFRTSQSRKFSDQARVLAIKAAKEKAVLMAKALDRSIGAALEITEVSASAVYPGRSLMAFGARANLQNASMDAGAQNDSISGDTIALGQIKVKADVVVVFELK